MFWTFNIVYCSSLYRQECANRGEDDQNCDGDQAQQQHLRAPVLIFCGKPRLRPFLTTDDEAQVEARAEHFGQRKAGLVVDDMIRSRRQTGLVEMHNLGRSQGCADAVREPPQYPDKVWIVADHQRLGIAIDHQSPLAGCRGGRGQGHWQHSSGRPVVSDLEPVDSTRAPYRPPRW